VTIALDTNVVSEPLKPAPAQSVLDWLDRQAPETPHLMAVRVAELLAGNEVLSQGRRGIELELAFTRQILPLFEGRILSFDAKAAEAFGRVRAGAQVVGNTIGFADGAIAAIAAAQGFALATRNIRDFRGSGVELINPWD
jgi:predicted nucleic acid-binding protein